MADSTGHMDRPGAGPSSAMMYINSIPTNHYINHNPQSGRVEIARPMPPGTPDELVMDFATTEEAWAWASAKWGEGQFKG